MNQIKKYLSLFKHSGNEIFSAIFMFNKLKNKELSVESTWFYKFRKKNNATIAKNTSSDCVDCKKNMNVLQI